MRIGTCIQFDDAEHIAKKFETLRNSGFDCCQLVSWKPALWTTENAAEIRRHAEENGVTLSAFWCGWEGALPGIFTKGRRPLGSFPRPSAPCGSGIYATARTLPRRSAFRTSSPIWGFIPENPCDPEYEGFCDAVRTVALHCRKTDSICFLRQGRKHP